MNKLIGGGLILAMLGTSLTASIDKKGDTVPQTLIDKTYLENINDKQEFYESQPNINQLMKRDYEITNEDMKNWNEWSSYRIMKIEQEKEKQRRIEEEKKRLEEEKQRQWEIERQKGQDVGDFRVSFYTAYCEGCSGITATGIDVRNTNYYNGLQIIATDPNVIPMYSIVELQFQNGSTVKAIAMDKGGAIKGNKIDHLVSTKSEAYSRGVQIANVKILKRGGE